MSKNKKISFIVIGVIVLVSIFYGGVVYGKSHASTASRTAAFGTGNFAGGARGTRGGMGGFTTGTILSRDATSITVSLMSGGSKIIFLDTNTKISKQADGTLADLATGTQVSITGASNADGSINATTVQIRPKMATTNTTP